MVFSRLIISLTTCTSGSICFAASTLRLRKVLSAKQIEPLVQVVSEMISRLKTNHLNRMANGECSIYADADFTNLMVAFKRIAAICSNIGVATMLRVKPELADHEHFYYESLHEGGDEAFDTSYRKARDKYFHTLDDISGGEETGSEPVPENAEKEEQSDE